MKKILYRLLVIGSFSALIGGIAVFAVLTYFSFSLPKISSLADYRPAIKSKILSKDGVVLAETGTEDREITKMGEVPERIIDAFISAEDSGFYEHTGVDYLGVARALVANLKAGRVVQGGSTITQQVAKSLLLTRERSISRKLKDFLLAQKIEKRFTKKEILFLYLNQVYLGGGYYGVKSAFRGYFGKELSEATVAESALIAGLLVAPGRYSPYIKPKYAKKRQNYVLGRMLANNKITKAEYDEAINEKIKYRLRRGGEFKAGYFTETVRQKVVELVGKENFLTNGFTVQTTLDYELQAVAEKEILKGTRNIDKRQGFKGPLKKVDLSTLPSLITEFRKKTYRDNSNYFTLGDDNKRVYEISLDEMEVENLISYKDEVSKEFKNSRFIPGILEGDKLVDQLDTESLYEAVVLKVDDYARLVYVTIGGVPGIIPYRYFRWAHEREISDERKYFPYVTKPSTILSAGDVVHVQIKSKRATIAKNARKNFVTNFLDKSSDKEFVDNQVYLLCALEQRVDVQAALMSLNPFTGEVVSMVGGTDFNLSKFNRALQSKRQPGSSFKPMLFAAGLENGYMPNTPILDTPEALGGNDSNLNWKPRNYDGKFKGAMTFRESLEQSRNIPTIKIAMSLGMKKVFEYLDRVNFKAEMPKDLSISLGSFGATLLEMIKAYSIYPNGGQRVVPKLITSIVDRDGKEYIGIEDAKEDHLDISSSDSQDDNQEGIVEDIKDEALSDGEQVAEEEKEEVNPYHMLLNEDQVYDPRLAYIMTNLLKGVVHNGTGRRALSVGKYLGGKTGTTSSYIDAWFLGFSQNIVTGVWTGFDNNKTMGWGETGSKSALPIWAGYMAESIKKYGVSDFKLPQGIVNSYINKKTGRPSEENDPDSFLESFVEGTEPGNESIKSFFKKDEPKASETEIFEDDEYFNNQ